jgi:hypothetical protein
MATGFPKGIRKRLGFTQEDEDIFACQLLSVFGWILFVLLVNFFVLHKSNTIPQAEAVWVEPPPQAVAPQKLVEPLLAMVQPDREDLWRDFRPDDHKPNYYFLYRDQIRFVDRIPEKKTMVASLKPTVPAPEKKKLEKNQEAPLEKVTTKPPEWVDLPLVETRKEARQVEPVREAPVNPAPERVQVAMVKDLDMDLDVVRDAPVAAMVPDEPRQTAARKSRVVEAVDVPMEIAQPTQSRPMGTVVAAAAPAAVVRPSTAADFVALPMDVASEKGTPKGSPGGAGTAEKVSAARPLFTARAAEDAVGLSMNLNVGEGKGNVSRSGSEGSIKGESSSARLLGGNPKNLGGIDLGSGMIVAKQKEPARPVEPEPPRAAVRIPLRQGPGQIPLGTPLAFRLADVGEETNSGSAYLTRSTQLKKFLDGKRLPGAPVTISLEEQGGSVSEGNGEVVGLSYSNSQIVLQYATGKQQVVTLVPGEPYPRFELRLAAGGASNVSVGTKLEEITSCLQTLQRVLKE